MPIIEIKKKAILLDKEEYHSLIAVLDYAWHRASKHNTPISEYEDFINYLRKKLTEV